MHVGHLEHVLWHYGAEGGVQPGAFTASLMETMAKADQRNLDRLITAFPNLGAPWRIARNHPGGIAALQRASRERQKAEAAGIIRIHSPRELEQYAAEEAARR